MKETTREIVRVTGYATDFGTECSDKNSCAELEKQEYREVYKSLYETADKKQKILLDAIMDELSLHIDDNLCERDVLNDALRELVIEERNLGPYNVDC